MRIVGDRVRNGVAVEKQLFISLRRIKNFVAEVCH